jgi:hypothetical protein
LFQIQVITQLWIKGISNGIFKDTGEASGFGIDSEEKFLVASQRNSRVDIKRSEHKR